MIRLGLMTIVYSFPTYFFFIDLSQMEKGKMTLNTNTPASTTSTSIINSHSLNSLGKRRLFNNNSFIHKLLNNNALKYFLRHILMFLLIFFQKLFYFHDKPRPSKSYCLNVLINRKLSSCELLNKYDFHFDSLRLLHSNIFPPNQ